MLLCGVIDTLGGAAACCKQASGTLLVLALRVQARAERSDARHRVSTPKSVPRYVRCYRTYPSASMRAPCFTRTSLTSSNACEHSGRPLLRRRWLACCAQRPLSPPSRASAFSPSIASHERPCTCAPRPAPHRPSARQPRAPRGAPAHADATLVPADFPPRPLAHRAHRLRATSRR